jgi:hypothetical protein
MASAVSRELKITYGAAVVGGTSEREIHGPHSMEILFDRFVLNFQVIVRGDTEAAAVAAWTLFESEFNARDNAVLVEMGAQTVETWDPAANTGFNTIANARKSGDLSVDSGRARLYTVTISGETPVSDERNANITIRFDAARRAEIIFDLEYTAEGVQSASAKYLADSPAYMASKISSYLSGRTMKLFSEEYRPDRTDKTATARIHWRERISTGTASVLDHANIEDQTFQVRLNKPAPGDSGQGIVRLRECTAQFVAVVNKEENTDLDALWLDVILPYMDEQVEAIYGPEQIARVDEDAQYIATSNHIVATCAYRLAIGATDVIESRVTVGFDEDSGIDFTPAWDDDPLGIYVDAGPQSKLRISRRITTVLGAIKAKSRLGGGGSFFGADFRNEDGSTAQGTGGNGGLEPSSGGGEPNSNGWNLVKNTSNATQLWIGTEELGFWITVLEESVVERFVNRPSGGGRRGRGGINPGGGTPVVGIGGPRT